MPDFTQIKLNVDGPIATITLYRPEKMNAFTHRMRDEMIAAIDITDADDAVRAVIVTGEGERAFCAGADLTPPSNDDGTPRHVFSDPTTVDDLSDPIVRDGGGQLVLRLFNSKKPLIGACNGVAVGVGATMQLPFDMRLASENARFGFVFANVPDDPKDLDAVAAFILGAVERAVGLRLLDDHAERGVGRGLRLSTRARR